MFSARSIDHMRLMPRARATSDQMGHEDHAQTVVLPLVKNGDRDSQAVPSADVLYRLTPTIFSPDASGTTAANAKSRV